MFQLTAITVVPNTGLAAPTAVGFEPVEPCRYESNKFSLPCGHEKPKQSSAPAARAETGPRRREYRFEDVRGTTLPREGHLRPPANASAPSAPGSYSRC
jgi:hypothetical protein